MEIEFKEPPKARGQRRPNGMHAVIAAELRDRPDEWAMIGTQPNSKSAGSLAHAIRRAQLRAYAPEGTYDARSQKVDGEYRVYAKYVGTSDE